MDGWLDGGRKSFDPSIINTKEDGQITVHVIPNIEKHFGTLHFCPLHVETINNAL